MLLNVKDWRKLWSAGICHRFLIEGLDVHDHKAAPSRRTPKLIQLLGHRYEMNGQLCSHVRRKRCCAGFDVAALPIELRQILAEVDDQNVHEVATQPAAMIFTGRH